MLRLFFIFFIIVYVTGCGILQSVSNDSLYCGERLSGEDPIHIESCGPEAVVQAITIMGIDSRVSHKKISRHIQKNSVFPIRSFLSVFNERARGITFPFEIKRVLSVYNVTTKELNSIKDLEEEDVAIVLIREKFSLDYHWVCYPAWRNPQSFFGENDTLIIKILLLKNNNESYFLLGNHFP